MRQTSAFASEAADASESTESGEWPVQQESSTEVYDISYESSSAEGSAEQMKGIAVGVP